MTSSTEIAVAIGISSCASTTCLPPSEVMGTILYHGPFDPKYYEMGQPPYQNFSLAIPSSIPTGNAQINVAHAALVGVSEARHLQYISGC